MAHNGKHEGEKKKEVALKLAGAPQGGAGPINYRKKRSGRKKPLKFTTLAKVKQRGSEGGGRKRKEITRMVGPVGKSDFRESRHLRQQPPTRGERGEKKKKGTPP